MMVMVPMMQMTPGIEIRGSRSKTCEIQLLLLLLLLNIVTNSICGFVCMRFIRFFGYCALHIYIYVYTNKQPTMYRTNNVYSWVDVGWD